MPLTPATAAAELLELAAHDLRTRQELVCQQELFGGYHPRMAAVHRENATRLRAIVDAIGWPTTARVGDEASEAAWLVLQHAIGEPELLRAMLPVLCEHAERGETPGWQAAMLEDRVRALEGRPQRYGTQLDWDEHGQLVPWPAIEDAEAVDERRAAVGLQPLAEVLADRRRTAVLEGDQPPPDVEAKRREGEAWARRVGWGLTRRLV